MKFEHDGFHGDICFSYGDIHKNFGYNALQKIPTILWFFSQNQTLDNPLAETDLPEHKGFSLESMQDMLMTTENLVEFLESYKPNHIRNDNEFNQDAAWAGIDGWVSGPGSTIYEVQKKGPLLVFGESYRHRDLETIMTLNVIEVRKMLDSYVRHIITEDRYGRQQDATIDLFHRLKNLC